jgi:prepilin-type N-terminal cleavage/methylation domain-containing protein
MRAERQRGWSLLEVMAAVVVVGLGLALFTKVQKMSSQGSNTNSRIMMAGKMIEKHLEDTRINIARDTVANWPPRTVTIAASAPSWISLSSVVSGARSPKDGAVVANVVRMDITARWTMPVRDSLVVTTYVSKRF